VGVGDAEGQAGLANNPKLNPLQGSVLGSTKHPDIPVTMSIKPTTFFIVSPLTKAIPL